MSETYSLTPHESVTVHSHRPELLEVEATYHPGGSQPPKHLHPSQAEHFEVLEGELQARVGGEQRTLRTGDTLDIPTGTPHQMWNASDGPTRVAWQTRPAGRTLEWFATLDRLRREGRVGKDGMPGPLAFGVYLTEYRDVFRLAGPDFLLRPALGLLGAIGRRRGYRVG
jgi:quercetin dioxygenase-like cupin family protein